MVDALEIGYAIKDRRAELGMTQAQVAEAAGVSKRCLWSLELGQNPGVQLDKLTAVLDALGLGLELTVHSTDTAKTTFVNNEASPDAAQTIPSDGKTPICSDNPDTLDALVILTGDAR